MTLSMTARGPEDLLAAVPIVLGFDPHDSVVMLTFSGDERFHARLDMPADRGADDDAVAMLLAPTLAHAVDTVAFVLYTADAVRADELARVLLERFGGAGVDVVDCLRADSGRWHTACGDGSGSGGEGVPYDAARHPFRARAIVDGYVTLGSRAELEESIAPQPDAVAEVARALPSARALTAAGVVATVARGLASGSAGTPSEVAALLLALRDPLRRDATWSGMGRDAARDHVRLWSEVVRRSPDTHVADPAALLAFSAWLCGQGALGWCAVDRCLAVAPKHRLGQLVGSVLEQALPPSVWGPAA